MADAPDSPKKILVVDDDTALCNMIAVTLKEAGYQAFAAFSGEEGLKLFHQEQPDLILLDFAMPGMNGFEVVSEIRRVESPGQRTPILFITAYSQAFLVSVDFHVGVDGYLTKPIVPNELLSHVKDILAARG